LSVDVSVSENHTVSIFRTTVYTAPKPRRTSSSVEEYVLGRPRGRLKDNIKINLGNIIDEVVNWIE
jgi:hypothetical protein